jgi:hypothetical protein
MRSWLRLNALALTMFAAFFVFLVLQSVFGWQTRNDELVEAGRAAEGYWAYLGTGHFAEATFENWESEFLQMGSYVLLTAFLVQRGSPESHPISDEPSGRTRRGPFAAVAWPSRSTSTASPSRCSASSRCRS